MTQPRSTSLRDPESGPLLDLVPVMAVLSVLQMLAAAFLRLALFAPWLASHPESRDPGGTALCHGP